MSLDGAFLHSVIAEMEGRKLIGSRVDKVYQPSREEIIVSLRTFGGTEKILLSADSSSARVCLTNTSPKNPKQPPLLCMLMRKYLTGALIKNVRQQEMDRILFVDFDAERRYFQEKFNKDFIKLLSFARTSGTMSIILSAVVTVPETGRSYRCRSAGHETGHRSS